MGGTYDPQHFYRGRGMGRSTVATPPPPFSKTVAMRPLKVLMCAILMQEKSQTGCNSSWFVEARNFKKNELILHAMC